jgi:outer membrane immunogenic protein
VVPWTWQGFYIGINGGAVWHRATFSAQDNAAPPNFASGKISTTGAAFGGHAGFNLQSGNVVYGIEADGSWVDASGSGFAGPPNQQWTTKLSWLATIRGRLGLTFSPTMVYVTGGFAAGRVTNSLPTQFGGFPSNRETRSGWTVGGGVEHMLTPHWLIRAEALYVDLGDTTVQGFLGSGYTARFANKVMVARGGVSLKW